MGLKRALKIIVLTKAMDKRKKANPFDAEYSDNFQLPAGADDSQNNSHYLSVHDLYSPFKLFLRVGRRGGNCPDEMWFTCRDKYGNVYMAEKDHFEKGEKLPAAVTCVKAGEKLVFTYDGLVRPAKKGKGGYEPDTGAAEVPLSLRAEFNAAGECFEFSRHMSSKPMALALSKEKFTKEFRAALSTHHQIHYEQHGSASGSLSVGGAPYNFENTPAFRDHSYGKRDWGYMDRYVWLVALLENGDFIHTSLIRYPAVTEIQAGFYKSGGNTVSILRATSMDALPITGSVPESFAFDIEYVDGTKKHAECKLDFKVPYRFGGGAYNVGEGVSAFTVNGVKGRGITEFGFNADESRWYREKK
jgi:hypothetical protein